MGNSFFDPSGNYGAGSGQPVLDWLLPILAIMYLICAVVLLGFGGHVYFLVMMRYRMMRRKREAVGRRFDDLPRVTIQVPVFNEGLIAVEAARCMTNLDYPRDRLQVIMVDGSTDGTPEMLAPVVANLQRQGCDIVHYKRDNSRGYKAGGLSEAVELSSGEFIAIFDADFRPPQDFLQRTIHNFVEPRVGCVQTRWGHSNGNANTLTVCQTMTLDAFYGTELPVRWHYGLVALFTGTGGIWRKNCIVDAGGWQWDTLAEDMDLSYRAQLRGWRFVYEQDVVSYGELPDTLTGLMRQQHRWTMGHTQVCRKLLGPVLRSGFSLPKKIETLIHMFRWMNYPGLLLMALLMAPALVISPRVELASRTEYIFGLLFFCLATGAAGVFYASGQMILNPGRWYRKMLAIPVMMGLSLAQAPYNSRGSIMALLGKSEKFHKTPRSGEQLIRIRGAESWLPWVNLTIGLYLMSGAALAFYWVWRIEDWSLLIPAFTQMMFASGALYASYAGWRQRRGSSRPSSSPTLASAPAS